MDVDLDRDNHPGPHHLGRILGREYPIRPMGALDVLAGATLELSRSRFDTHVVSVVGLYFPAASHWKLR